MHTTLEDRIRIQTLVNAGLPAAAIAAQLGWSVATVRKWRRRLRQGPLLAAPALGRPATGALSHFAPELAATLLAWRQAHPGWGPTTLRAELAADPGFAASPLPSRATLARFLRAHAALRPYQHHTALPPPPAAGATQPHEHWQLDARGVSMVPGVGHVMLINVNDCASHIHLLSYPCLVGTARVARHPATPDYQVALRLAFTDWGLPQRLQVDHESSFYDNSSPSPFPTLLHLWLCALGVAVTFSPVGRPTAQGLTERSHQFWAAQVLQGQRFADWDHLYHALRTRRDFVNRHLPCAGTQHQPPLVAWPTAAHPVRGYRPEWEPELLDLAAVYEYLSQGRWVRQGSATGTVSLGGQVYCLGPTWAKQPIEVGVVAAGAQVCFRSAGGQQTTRPLRGVSGPALMGPLGPVMQLPLFQLALPFSWDTWQVLRLCETLEPV